MSKDKVEINEERLNEWVRRYKKAVLESLENDGHSISFYLVFFKSPLLLAEDKTSESFNYAWRIVESSSWVLSPLSNHFYPNEESRTFFENN